MSEIGKLIHRLTATDRASVVRRMIIAEKSKPCVDCGTYYPPEVNGV